MTSAAKFGDFERAMRPHMGAAYNLARWLLRESADAEDVLQEAFVRAFRYFDTFRGERARSWLLAIVRNTCWSFIARRGEQEEVTAVPIGTVMSRLSRARRELQARLGGAARKAGVS